MKPPEHAPLTADMEAALQLLARSTDSALVRLHSQWWVLESDARGGVNQLTAESLQAGRPVFDRPVVHTHTVDALVRRARLRLTGPKRKGPGYNGRARAEVIPQ